MNQMHAGAVSILYRGENSAEERIAEYDKKIANPMIAARRGFVDDIIDPKHTRSVICNDLLLLRSKMMPEIQKKHSNIPL